MFCPLKFHNCLPMVPCEQKLMAFPFDQERFIKYSLTSLEAQYSPSLLLPLDLGVTVDLINPEIYEIKTPGDLALEDAELLHEPIKQKQISKTNRDYSNSSGYLRKSTLPAGPIAYCQPSSAKEEKVEFDVEAEFDSTNLIPKITNAFNTKEFVHPTKPHLKIDKVYNVLPEEHQLSTEFVMVVFDEEPDDKTRLNILKEFADEDDAHLLSLYAEEFKEEMEDYEENSEEESEKLKLDKDTKNYAFLRNYKYSYLNDPNQNDVIMWIDDETMAVYYSIVENKLQLKKKPIPKSAGGKNIPDRIVGIKLRPEKKSELIVRKDKLLENGFLPESGMETPVLNSMEDDMYDEENHEVNNLMAKLFGSDDESENND